MRKITLGGVSPVADVGESDSASSVKRPAVWVLASILMSSFSNFLASALVFRTRGGTGDVAASVVVLTTSLASIGVLRGAGTTTAARLAARGQSASGVLRLLAAAAVVLNVMAIHIGLLGTSWWSPYVLVVLLIASCAIAAEEALRILHISRGRPELAFWMDFTWVLTMMLPIALVLSGHEPSGPTFLGLWALGAGLGAVVGASVMRGDNWPYVQVPTKHLETHFRTASIAAIPALSALVVTSILNARVPVWFGESAYISYRGALTACTPIALVGAAFPAVLLSAIAIGHSGTAKSYLPLVSRFCLLTLFVAGLAVVLVKVISHAVWVSWLGSNADLTLSLIPSVAFGFLGAALAALPAALVSATKSVSRGVVLALVAQWLALTGLALPASHGAPIATANWVAGISVWLGALLAVVVILIVRSMGRPITTKL